MNRRVFAALAGAAAVFAVQAVAQDIKRKEDTASTPRETVRGTLQARDDGKTTSASSTTKTKPPKPPPVPPPPDAVIPEHPKDYYAARTRALIHTDDTGTTMPYRLFVPDRLDADRKYPLVLSLHGAGERGSDNLKQLSSYAAGWTDEGFQKEHPCFIVIPQCPAGVSWANYADPHRSTGPDTGELKRVMEILDKVAAEYPVDRGRVYAVGASMGAAGAWDAIMHHTSVFAAALIVAGSGDTSGSALLANLPIWVHYGAKDTAVKPQRMRDMVAALKLISAKVRSTEYPDTRHEVCYWVWRRKPVTDWLFAQQKASP